MVRMPIPFLKLARCAPIAVPLSVDSHICIQMYTCDCPDSLIRASICKHIHLLVRFLSASSTPIVIPTDTKNDYNTEKTEVLKDIQKPDTLNDPTTCRRKIHDKLMILNKSISGISDIDTLHEVSGLITSALNLIKFKQESTAVTLPTTDYQPPNQNIAVQ